MAFISFLTRRAAARALLVVACGAGLAAHAGPLRAALDRLIRAGVVREVDVASTARSLWASVHGWVMLEIADGASPGPDSDAAFDWHLRVSLLGMASDAVHDEYA